MTDIRRNTIIEIIDNIGDISLNELSEKFPDVSLMTLRRDLIQLEKEGYILRTRGGAVSLKKLSRASAVAGEENEFFLRAGENIKEKMLIANKALPFVSKGNAIYFDAGSTIMYLARIVQDDSLSIITNGVNVAQELVSHPKITVMVPGGTVNRNTLSVSGSDSIQFIEKINIELAFMSASAFSLDTGFSVSNIYEAELKRKVISRAKKTFMLMDSSKVGKSLLFTLADLKDIDYLISDRPLPPAVSAAASKLNVTIL